MIQADVAVVGAGAAGASVVAGLLGRAARPLRIQVIDPGPGTGRGVAYRTADPRHVLNVAAEKMSAVEDDPTHFARWAARRGWDAPTGGFLPRWVFGAYLEDHVERARRSRPDASVGRVVGRVVDVAADRGGYLLRLDDGGQVRSASVVIATGPHPPDGAWVPDGLRRSSALVADPWAPGALDAVPEGRDVLVVGTGLTMVDLAASLARPDRVVHAVSRHGLLPRAHAVDPRPGRAPEIGPPAPDLPAVRGWWREHLRRCLRGDGDWRPAVDGLRGLTPSLWAALSEDDRACFLERDARLWSTLRHRVAPSTARDLGALRRSGRVIVHRGAVVDAARVPDGAAARVRLSTGEQVDAGAVLDATGPQWRPARSGDPLAERLLRRGLARPGPCGLGYETDEAGRLRGADRSAGGALFTLGALRCGDLWESSAFPEIRAQAAAVADAVLARPDPAALGRSGGRPAAVA